MLVGLVANPTSTKDIRRLTTLARVIDLEETANLVARLLVGLASEDGIEGMALDDPAGLARSAVAMAGRSAAPVDFLPVRLEGDVLLVLALSLLTTLHAQPLGCCSQRFAR